MKSYYNTNNESGRTLKDSVQKAETQEKSVHTLFLKHKELTASETWNRFQNNDRYITPITSIRRSITNLCARGILEKTETMRPGLYGKNEHIYKLIQLDFTQLTLF